MSPSRALSPLSRALLLACLGGPVLVSAGSACAAEIRTDARQYYRLPAEPLEQALNHLGRQAGVLIAFSPEQTAARLQPGAGRRIHPGGSPGRPARRLRPGGARPRRRRLHPGSAAGGRPGQPAGAHRGRRLAGRRQRRRRLRASRCARRGPPRAVPGPRRGQHPRSAGAHSRVSAPLNNGTGSHDLALNFGIRGLNPRLASRSTVLMDGIPVPFAPTASHSCRWRRCPSATWTRWTWSAAAARCATGRRTSAASSTS